jgi:hypothetical protein
MGTARIYRVGTRDALFDTTGRVLLPPTLSPPEALASAEAWTKGRQESFSWSEPETRLAREHEQYMDIVDATLATGLSNQVALHLKGHLNHGIPYELFIRAKEVSLLRSDHERSSVEELDEMGAVYRESRLRAAVRSWRRTFEVAYASISVSRASRRT